MKAVIYNCEGFQWDEGNSLKNWNLHQVTDHECEEIFFNLPLITAQDSKHSTSEKRYYSLGRTDAARWLFISFTIRNNLFQIISARNMNKKETRKYAEKIKKYP